MTRADLERRRDELREAMRQATLHVERLRGALALLDELLATEPATEPDARTDNGNDPNE